MRTAATRENVEKAFGSLLTDAQADMLTEFEVLDDPTGASTVGDALAMLRQYFHTWGGVRHSEPRARAPHPVTDRLAVVDRLHAIHAQPEVDALRDRLNFACMSLEQKVAMTRNRSRHRAEPPRTLPLAEDEDLVAWIEGRWATEWGADALRDPHALGRFTASGGSVEVLSYPTGRTVRRRTVRSSGALGELAIGARKLAERWMWEEHEAVRWVLADSTPPHVVCARSGFQVQQIGRLDTMSRIVLELDPELTPEEVAAIYARARARGRPGKRVRHVTPKALALARLVLDHPEEEWDDLLHRWNRGTARTHNDYQMTAVGRSNFIRDAKAALARLQHRGWHP